MKTKLLAIAAFSILSALGAGCEQEGPAEKAGESIDQAVENAGDKIESTLDPKGPAEKAGEAIDKGIQNTRDAVKEAGDKLREAQ